MFVGESAIFSERIVVINLRLTIAHPK
jgi:hypothetical protein